MTFSWKKKIRRNGFSKLVADLQSPKHGGSLVVETGFPTSLIDLYVRNRGRFCKSNANKQQSGNDMNGYNGECEIEDDKCEIESVKRSEVESDEIIEEIEDEKHEIESVKYCEVESKKCGEIEVEKSVEMAKLNPVYAVLLKVLLMMVLVLGTKSLKFGITVSAFVLFLLELVGKPFTGRLSLIRRSSIDLDAPIESLYIESLKKNKVRTTTDVSKEVLEIEEQVESKKEVRSDEARSEGSIEIRHKSSRKAIMKSRMKKLVPKKLRKSSVGPKDEIISCTSKEVKERVRCAQDVKPLVVSGLRSDSKGVAFCIARQEQEEIVELEGQSSSLTKSSELDCEDSMEQEREHNSGYLVLCLIVLLGLIGGRVLAFVLALSWCFLMTRIQWRNVTFPIS